MKKYTMGWASFMLLAVAFTGCRTQQQARAPEESQPAMTDVALADQEPSLRGKDYQEVPELEVIHFEFNEATLRPEARDTLKRNAEVLQQHPDWEVLVEGHADQRGTTEYNLGLGQRRAAAVRSFYAQLGVPGKRIATLSYGKEKLVCAQATEDCFSQNRRAPTKVRASADRASL